MSEQYIRMWNKWFHEIHDKVKDLNTRMRYENKLLQNLINKMKERDQDGNRK